MICAGFMAAMLLPLYSPINSCTHTHTHSLTRKSQRFFMLLFLGIFQIKKIEGRNGDGGHVMGFIVWNVLSPPTLLLFFIVPLDVLFNIDWWMSTSYRDLKVNRVQLKWNFCFQGFSSLYEIFLNFPGWGNTSKKQTEFSNLQNSNTSRLISKKHL